MSDPAEVARLDQIIAYALDVQVRIYEHRRSLIEAGWTEPEAWILSLRVEERILGPVFGSGVEEDEGFFP
jgi:hypothetical protein